MFIHESDVSGRSSHRCRKTLLMPSMCCCRELLEWARTSSSSSSLSSLCDCVCDSSTSSWRSELTSCSLRASDEWFILSSFGSVHAVLPAERHLAAACKVVVCLDTDAVWGRRDEVTWSISERFSISRCVRSLPSTDCRLLTLWWMTLTARDSSSRDCCWLLLLAVSDDSLTSTLNSGKASLFVRWSTFVTELQDTSAFVADTSFAILWSEDVVVLWCDVISELANVKCVESRCALMLTGLTGSLITGSTGLTRSRLLRCASLTVAVPAQLTVDARPWRPPWLLQRASVVAVQAGSTLALVAWLSATRWLAVVVVIDRRWWAFVHWSRDALYQQIQCIQLHVHNPYTLTISD